MVSGDRQVSIGEKGPFFAMQREFSRYFERIDVICPRPEKPVTVTTIWDRVHFHPAQCGRSKMARYVLEKGRELLAEHGASLIVSHDYGWFYNGVGSAKLSRESGVPYLSEIHHVPGHPVAANWRERFDKHIARRYVRWACERVKAFRVVNSQEMPELLASWGVPREKILVLPSLYIDLEVFRPAANARSERGAESSPRGARPPGEDREFDQDVVFVGRMVANKGLDRIVDAIARLASAGHPLSVLFVGKGPLASELRERVKKRGIEERARFVEWVDTPSDLAETYRRSRVCVCASTCEGGPRFTVEAMACGTPVVSTRVGVMGELLVRGDTGVLCGFDVESLARGIESVLSDETRRRAMGSRARADAQRFEYSGTIRGYANGLKELAGESVGDAREVPAR
jgi:glycosyltransferase involved in cell wall biosynthesis